jgi:TonB family protein
MRLAGTLRTRRVLSSIVAAAISNVCLATAPSKTVDTVPARVVVKNSKRPEYPLSARQQHLEGAGVFLLHLKDNGSVKSVEVLQSTGHAILDKSCVSAFRQWEFQPEFTKKSKKVKIPIAFKMGEVHSPYSSD